MATSQGQSVSPDLAALRIQRVEIGDSTKPLRRMRWFAGAGLALVAGIFAAASASWSRGRTVAVGRVVLEQPAEPEAELTATGYAIAQRSAVLGTKVLGRVARVHAAEGDRVAPGAPLISLDGGDLARSSVAARARARAALTRVQVARARFAELDQRYQRERGLAEKGVSPRATAQDLGAELATLAASLNAAAADAETAGADVEVFRAQLDELEIRAPFGGVIATAPVERGQIVSPGTPLLELIDPESILIEADVPEAQLARARVGAPCELAFDAFPERRFSGEVVLIGPRLDRAKATGVVKVRASDPIEGGLRPGMAARVRFLSAPIAGGERRVEAKLSVPPRAVVKRGERSMVFVVEGAAVRIAPLEGLTPGTRVVLDPPPSLEDGDRIEEEQP